MYLIAAVAGALADATDARLESYRRQGLTLAAPANDDIRQHRFDELKATNTDPRLGDAALADMARGYRPLLPPLVARLEGLANIVSSPQIREAKLHEA